MKKSMSAKRICGCGSGPSLRDSRSDGNLSLSAKLKAVPQGRLLRSEPRQTGLGEEPDEEDGERSERGLQFEASSYWESAFRAIPLSRLNEGRPVRTAFIVNLAPNYRSIIAPGMNVRQPTFLAACGSARGTCLWVSHPAVANCSARRERTR